MRYYLGQLSVGLIFLCWARSKSLERATYSSSYRITTMWFGFVLYLRSLQWKVIPPPSQTSESALAYHFISFSFGWIVIMHVHYILPNIPLQYTYENAIILMEAETVPGEKPRCKLLWFFFPVIKTSISVVLHEDTAQQFVFSLLQDHQTGQLTQRSEEY